ncbi:MAG: NAD(P)H-dependent oxidoreductase subunit E [Clostridia bacterium]|nr:NAD(P)H-dependent oxidoreductase subunit E [Clostridia bacterium]
METRLKLNTTTAEYKKFIKEFNELKTTTTPLIESLHLAQDCFGYIPYELQQLISDELKVSMSELYGVITFYKKFKLEPTAKNTIYICMGTACYIKDATAILNKLEKILKVKAGESTEDKKFFIDTTRCVGSCGNAPVMLINSKVYKNVKIDELESILNSY